VGKGPKCSDFPFSDPLNFLPSPCRHCKFLAPLRRPAVLPYCFLDADGSPHYGVSMRAVDQWSGLLDRFGQRILTRVWAYGADCEEAWRDTLPKYQAMAREVGKECIVNTPQAVDAAGAGHSWPGPTIETKSNEPVSSEYTTTHAIQTGQTGRH
jgi:hypothetical protein